MRPWISPAAADHYALYSVPRIIQKAPLFKGELPAPPAEGIIHYSLFIINCSLGAMRPWISPAAADHYALYSVPRIIQKAPLFKGELPALPAEGINLQIHYTFSLFPVADVVILSKAAKPRRRISSRIHLPSFILLRPANILCHPDRSGGIPY